MIMKIVYLYDAVFMKGLINMSYNIMSLYNSNYSWLFGSTYSSSKSYNSLSNDFLSQIGNASLYNTSGYRNLLKSVYSSEKTQQNNTTATAYNTLATATADLATSASKLSDDSLYVADKDGNYDTEKISEIVKNFVSDYNDVVKNTTKVENVNSLQRSKYLMNETSVNSSLLKKVGITVKEDNTLSFDADKFSKANFTDIKSIFAGHNSYASKISNQANQINRIVNNEIRANKLSYRYNYTTGTMLDSYA